MLCETHEIMTKGKFDIMLLNFKLKNQFITIDGYSTVHMLVICFLVNYLHMKKILFSALFKNIFSIR